MSTSKTNAGSGTTTNPDPFQSILESILPLEDLATRGYDRAKISGTDKPLPEDLKVLEDHARAIARDAYTDNYDPNQHHHHKLREDQYQKDLTDLADAETANAFAATDVAEREDELAKKQSGRQKPEMPKVIFIAAVISFALSLGPTLHDRFFLTIEDEVLAWFVSLVGASVIGVLITWALLGSVAATGKRTVANFWGLIAGIGIGVGSCLLRVSDAQTQDEYIFAIALTLMEVSAVLFLDWLAAGFRKEYAEWAAHREEINVLIARLEAAQAAYDRRDKRVRDIEKNIRDHVRYVETLQIRHFKIQELEDAAVKTVIDSYHKGVASNRGRKLGLRLATSA
jgi:hypothetical protein